MIQVVGYTYVLVSVRVHYRLAVSPCNVTVYGYTIGYQSAQVMEQFS